MNSFETLSNPLLQGIVQTQEQREAEASTSGNELGQDAFLQLMIAQLNNQDPLNPQENGEFISQLAQFSSVEGITNVNNSINTLVSEVQSSRTLEAAALVGKTVEIDGNTLSHVAGQVASGSYALDLSSSSVTMTVKDGIGRTVYAQDLGTVPAGEHRFEWSGQTFSGQPADTGSYQVSISALQNGASVEVPVRTADLVQSVYLNTDNSVILNLASGKNVPVDDVRRLSSPTQPNLADSVNGFFNSYESSRVLAATSLIGQSVDYRVQSLQYQAGQQDFNAQVNLPAGADGGVFDVLDANGNIVFSQQVSGSGTKNLDWAGVDSSGVGVPSGEYQTRFTADLDGESVDVPVTSSAVVESVQPSQQGALQLNIAGGGAIAIDQLIT